MVKDRFVKPVITAPGPDASSRRAGRPLSYWHGLLSDTNLKPVKKPEPKAVVERLPEEQLRNILSALNDSDIDEIDGALANWMNDLAKLHPEDAKQIIMAALDSTSHSLHQKACENIGLLPEGGRADAIVTLVGRASEFSDSEMALFARVLEDCPDADKLKLVRAALGSSSDKLQAKACENISLLPESELVEMAETLSHRARASSYSYSDLSDADSRTFGCIFGSCSEEGKLRLIRIAFGSSSSELHAMACENISLLPKSEWVGGIEKVLAANHYARPPEDSASIMKAFQEVLVACTEEDQARLINAALRSPFQAVRMKACECIPLLMEGVRAGAIETALSSGGPDISAKAFEHVGICPEKDKAGLITIGLKSRDKGIPKRAFGLIEGRPEEAELLMEALDSEFEIMMLAAERACGFPEDEGLLEAAGRNVAHAFTIPRLHNDADALSLILKFPAKYRATMIAPVLRADNLTQAIGMISDEIPPEHRAGLWQKAAEVVKGEISKGRFDEDPTGVIRLFPPSEKANIIRYALDPVALEGYLSSSQTGSRITRLKTCQLIPGLEPGMREELWGLAAGTIAKAIWRSEEQIRQGALPLAAGIPTRHMRVVFWRIANSVHPDVRGKTAGMIDSMPADMQALYIQQAFEAYGSKTRREAFDRIFTLPEQQQIELLECALESSYEDVRMMAAAGKQGFPDKTRMALVPSLIHDTDERVRIAVALSSPVDDGARKKAVLLALKSGDLQVFLTALGSSKGLFSPDEQKKISRRSAFKKTKSALCSGQYDVRMKAADAITAFGGRRKYKLVKIALGSEHLGVRQKAIEHIIDYDDPRKQKKLVKRALGSRYGDNIVKIAFEILAEGGVTICGWQATELLKPAEKRLGELLKWANVEANRSNMEAISYWGLEREMDGAVIAHAMEWPFPQKFSISLAECASRSGPKGCLALARKSASFGSIRNCVLITALSHERYWAEAVSLIPSFPVSAQNNESRESLWSAAAANVEKAICSGIRPKQAAMALYTFPQERWPGLVALRDKIPPGPIVFSIAELAIGLPEKFDTDTLSWAALQISIGLDSPDAETCRRATLSLPAAGKYRQFDEMAWTDAVEKFKSMLGSAQYAVAAEASERIGMFPPERQPELIEAAMGAGWWFPILKGMECLAALPPRLQNEKMWDAAVSRVRSVRECSDESVRTRAVEIAAEFPGKYFTQILVDAIPDKAHLGKLVGQGLRTKQPAIHPVVIFYIAKLPDEQQNGMYAEAVKALAARLGSERAELAINASSLMEMFPSASQPALIEAALDSGWGFAALDAIKLLVKLPPDLQAEKSWEGAKKRAKAVLCRKGMPTANLIPKEMLEAVGCFPKPHMDDVLLHVLEENPEINEPGLFMLGMKSDNSQVAIAAAAGACRIAKRSGLYDTLDRPADGQEEIGETIPHPGSEGEHVDLLTTALGVVGKALCSQDFNTMEKASECAGDFPPIFQTSLIDLSLDYGFWLRVFNGISMLQKLPEPLQSEERWEKAARFIELAFKDSQGNFARRRVMELLPGFPKARLAELIAIAEKSEFEDVRSKLEEARQKLGQV